jgi:hypothetical protein
MKTKTTAKAIKERYKKCYSAGYGQLQFLLSRIEPLYYHAGVYGWDYDVYIIDDVAIFTGYRYPSSGIKHIPYEIAEKYDKYAKKIIDANHSNKYKFVLSVLKNLINDMITELN